MGDAREVWEKRIEEWRGSGLTRREFAKKHRISHGAMKWWAWKLSPKQLAREGGIVKDTAGAVVSAIETPLTFIEMASSPAIEAVLLNGIVVRIAPHFDPACLSRALDVLERRR